MKTTQNNFQSKTVKLSAALTSLLHHFPKSNSLVVVALMAPLNSSCSRFRSVAPTFMSKYKCSFILVNKLQKIYFILAAQDLKHNSNERRKKEEQTHLVTDNAGGLTLRAAKNWIVVTPLGSCH